MAEATAHQSTGKSPRSECAADVMRSRTAGSCYDLAIEVHFRCGYGVAVLVPIHAGAALEHQLADRDGTLRRMLW